MIPAMLRRRVLNLLQQTSLPELFGTGADGDLYIESGQTVTLNVPSKYVSVVEMNYKSITIESGGKLVCSTNNNGLVLRCQGNCVINGTIDQSLKSGLPNNSPTLDYPDEIICGNGGNGSYCHSSKVTSGGTGMSGHKGGGGWSGGGAGGTSDEKSSYATKRRGGNGGSVNTLTVASASASMFVGGGTGDNASGGAGSNGGGGGGGGGGGAIYIVYNGTYSNNGTMNVNGGGAGANGTDAGEESPTKGAASAGGNGTVTVKQFEKGMTK